MTKPGKTDARFAELTGQLVSHIGPMVTNAAETAPPDARIVAVSMVLTFRTGDGRLGETAAVSGCRCGNCYLTAVRKLAEAFGQPMPEMVSSVERAQVH